MVKLKNLYTFWKKINKLYTSLVYSILRVYSVVERICIRTEIEHRRCDEINPTSHPHNTFVYSKVMVCLFHYMYWPTHPILSLSYYTYTFISTSCILHMSC